MKNPRTKEGKTEAIIQLKKLYGLPPYDSIANPCLGDGYFASSITRDYGMSIDELEKIVGWPKIWDNYQQLRNRMLKEL